VSVFRLAFVRPCVPSTASRPPRGEGWLHEPKWDGFRFQVIKDGAGVRLYSKSGAEYTDRLPAVAEAFAKLPTRSAILDEELVLINPKGGAHFYRLMREMRTSHPDEAQLMFMAFDLLHQDGVDLRGVALSERKRDLNRLCRKSRVPFFRQVETFPDGDVLLDYCNRFEFEGVVSKRQSSRYVSGPSRHWLKTKCESWRRENTERYRMFEGNKKKPELTEKQKVLVRKRQQLARVLARLQAPDLRPGIARELRKQVAILEREIAELEQA
jgi:bifunctional non-homologous end joining protein LigD